MQKELTSQFKGCHLEFKCLSCNAPIPFSIFDLQTDKLLECSCCQKKYSFSEPNLVRQLKKFDALCRQIKESEEILGTANVGVDVGEHHVKVPYKLLLTRLSSSLDLKLGDKTISILFRMEPTKDLPPSTLEAIGGVAL